MNHIHAKAVWFEQQSTQPQKACDFYSALFGWQVQTMDMGNGPYHVMDNQGESESGITTAAKTAGWTPYFSVADVDAHQKSAQKLGATIIAPAFDLDQVGRISVLQEPSGAVFALFAAQKGDGEDRPSRENGFHWTELWSKDAEASMAFFRDLLGYKAEKMPSPKGVYYTMLSKDGPRLGITTSDKASSFLPYVRVAACDDSVAHGIKLGAVPTIPAMDMPGVGRFAAMLDPTGAQIGVITPAH